MDKVLRVTQEEKDQIRKHYNVTEESIKQDVEIIQTWLSKQPHLPQNLSDGVIEKILLRNKFRVERSKYKIDNYYSLRGKSDLVKKFEEVIPSKHITTLLPIPILTPNLERIVIMKILDTDPDHYDMSEIVKLNLAMEEVSIPHEYAVGVRYIFDWDGLTLRHMAKINPIPLAKHVTLLQEAYSCRMLGFEFINYPSFLSNLLVIVKLVVGSKLYGRIRLHENLESLQKVIPKEYLPSEYGGYLGDIHDMLVKWDDEFIKHKDYFIENYKNVSTEHLRMGETSTEFGIDGTFKKLAID